MINRKIKFISLLYIVFLYSHVWGQISPGDLSEAHKSLEGMSNCTQCHILGENVDNQKCLTCHTAIKNLITDNKGYHSSSEVKSKECTDCHGEHFGRDFDLIRFDKNKFDHNQTTFILDGKHLQLKCDECHKSEFIQIDSLKSKASTFLGLVNNCQSCHVDFHNGTLSSNKCVDCHNTNKWRPAPLFLHDKSKFKLVGAHQKVDCEKCHTKEIVNDKEFQKFTGLRFKFCIDCHTDIHNGKFGNNCLECHTQQSFKNVKNLNAFDHSKTNFQLLGKHKNVTCKNCHTKGIKAKLEYQNCSDCHEDYHKGEFSKNSIVEDCATCHSEDGFTPSHFTIEKHNQAKFKLTGSHFAVPCNACHLIDSKWKFKFEKNDCEMCHIDVHKTSLNYTKGIVLNCESCHSTEKWSAISFDHSKTKFELIGKHTEVACSKCHFTDVQLTHQFVDTSQNCESCHVDNHAGQFAAKYENNCAECHSSTNWKIDNFNHTKARFVLDGAHKDVKCIECHKEIEKEGKKLVQYKFEDITCKSCHK